MAVGEFRQWVVPGYPRLMVEFNPQPSPGTWQVPQDTLLSPESRESKNNIPPNCTFGSFVNGHPFASTV
jgi:hypothetical protein